MSSSSSPDTAPAPPSNSTSPTPPSNSTSPPSPTAATPPVSIPQPSPPNPPSSPSNPPSSPSNPPTSPSNPPPSPRNPPPSPSNPPPSPSNPPPSPSNPPSSPSNPPPSPSNPPSSPSNPPPSSPNPPPSPSNPPRSPSNPSPSPPNPPPSVPPIPPKSSPPPEVTPPHQPTPPSPPSTTPPPTPNPHPPPTPNRPPLSPKPETPPAPAGKHIPPPTHIKTSSTISTKLVVGIAFAGVVALIALILLFLCFKKKRRRRNNEAGYYVPPPPVDPKDRPYGGQQQYWQQQNGPPRPDPIAPAAPMPGTASPQPQQPIPVYNQPPPLPHQHNPVYNQTHPPQQHIPVHNQTHQPPPPPPFLSSSGGSGYSGSENPILPPPSPGMVLGYSSSMFTYEELARATDGFSDANLLGQGGFGYVHKGVLPNGKDIAVKQLKAGSGQGEREFQAEVEIISRVHHKHLVSLVGYCITGVQRMLVYEFVPNNNLEFHLHGKGRPTMDWPTRLKIALGSAKGLAYLHEDCHPRIIHRDIKASNILLDFKFEAMVADFGLAKISSDTNTHVSTRVMGTFGYLAPEYASSGKLTDKSDVFSFGVVLLELITGRRPVDPTHGFVNDSLVDWARPMMTLAIEDGNFDTLADPKMNEYDEDEMARMVACAAACVRHSARRRPRMSQIVRALEGNVSLSDLNEGIKPGHSKAHNSSTDYDGSQHSEAMKKLRKMALASTIEYGGSSEYSEPTTEYGLYPSGTSSEAQSTREMEMAAKTKKNDREGFRTTETGLKPSAANSESLQKKDQGFR